jgi:hypothetical protein
MLSSLYKKLIEVLNEKVWYCHRYLTIYNAELEGTISREDALSFYKKLHQDMFLKFPADDADLEAVSDHIQTFYL